MSCQVVILRGCDFFDFQNLSIVILSEAKDPVQTSSGTNSAGISATNADKAVERMPSGAGATARGYGIRRVAQDDKVICWGGKLKSKLTDLRTQGTFSIAAEAQAVRSIAVS